MRIVVRDHDRNRREVYNIRTIRSKNRDSKVVKDSDDDKIKDLEKRIDELEEAIKALSKKDEPSEEEPEVDEEDLDEVEEDETEVEEGEDETVEDLGDSCTKDSIKRPLRSIGTLLKASAKDSTPSNEEAEINAWKNR